MTSPQRTPDGEPAYLQDPAAIYRQSFAIIEAETDWSALPEALRPVATRMIHACGMPDIAEDLAWSQDFTTAATAALAAGAPVMTDCRMLLHGIVPSLLLAANPVVCTLDFAADGGGSTTRSAAAIDAAGNRLHGAVVAIGNAPTALFRLLERCALGTCRPAAILGLPVGFVGAAESKAALAAAAPVPFLTLHGRRGGSAIAAAAVNAVASLARERQARP